MFKYEHDEKKISLECTGTMADFVSDVITVVHLVHEKLKKSNEDMAKVFETMITDNIDMAFDDRAGLKKRMEKAVDESGEVKKAAKKLADAVRELSADELEALFNREED